MVILSPPMALRPHLDTLLHYDPSRSSSTVNVWVAHPGPSEELALGKLVVVSSIDRVTRLNHEIIGIIQEELQSQYYQSAELTMERAFERALQKTNERLHDVVAEGVSQWVAAAHFLVIAIKHQHVLLANVGKIQAFLIRRERLHPMLTSDDVVAPNPLRMFGQVISGQAEDHDRMIFCTPSLLDYFSLEKLRRTALDGHPSDVVRLLEGTILGAAPTYAMAAVVVEFEAAAERITAAPAGPTFSNAKYGRSAPQVSMDTLLERQRSTEKILTPSIWPAVADLGQRSGQAINRFIRVGIFRRPVRRQLSATTIPPSLARRETSGWSSMVMTFQGIGQKIITVARALVPARRPHIPTEPRLTEAAPEPSRPHRRWIDGVVMWFRRLQPSQQIALGILLIVVISLSAALAQRTKTLTPTASASTAQQIRDLAGRAQAALLYGGDQAAREDLRQADDLFQRLPKRTRSQRQTYDQLSSLLDTIHRQADHVTTIDQPKILADLHGSAASADPRQLYILGSIAIVADPKNNLVASVATSGSGTPLSTTNTLDTGSLLTGAVTSLSAVTFITNRQTFIEFDTTKKQWKPLDAAFPQPRPRIQFLSGYLGKVYVLDTAHNDIVRFTRGGLSLGTGSSWLKAPAQLSTARAAVVDGSIYVLQAGGQVEQFLAGKKTDFQLTAVAPTLTDATRLWTDGPSQHLYLLDPAHHRVVVTDKQGRLVDQYQSPAWSDLRDVVASEKTKTLYVLNGLSIQTATLIH